MTAPTKWSRDLNNLKDMLAAVKHLNHALWLAAHGLAEVADTNAIHAISEEIHDKLAFADKQIDVIREDFA